MPAGVFGKNHAVLRYPVSDMADRYPEPGGEAPPAAVVFDLFNTLTAPVDDSEFRSSLMEMALAVGADPDAFTQGWFDLWRERFSGVFPTVEASVRGVCDAIGLRVSETAISGAVRLCSEFSRRTLRPRPEALPTLARLRSLGLGTALISDCSPDVPVLWPTTPFAQAIDHPLFSCVEGLTKPDPSIYLRACQRLGVDPEDCVYVGDGGNHELSGAKRVGMRAILIKLPKETSAWHRSESDTWRGEAIQALSELPRLITGVGGPPPSID